MLTPSRVRRAIHHSLTALVTKLPPANSYLLTTDEGHSYQLHLDPPYYLCSCSWGSHDLSHHLSNACSHALAICARLDIDVPLDSPDAELSQGTD